MLGFVLLFLVAPVLAEETPNTFLTLFDVVTKEPIDEVYVKAELNGQFSNYYLEGGDELRLSLQPGTYNLKLLVNAPQTDAYDYYGEASFSVGESLVKVVYLYPVGSLSGFVKDRINNTISGASLKFECNGIFPVEFPGRTDKYGSFSIDAVPVGECVIRSSYSGSVGMKETKVERGSKTDVEIQLDHILIVPHSSRSNEYLGVLVVVVVLVIIGALVYRKKFMRKRKKEVKVIEQSEEEKQEEKGLGQRGQDILRTLRANEKKIIEFLLEHKHPAHLSKIHYKTGLSKSSIFRNLRSLEHKKIIETFNEGRVRKAKLTGWFRGK